MVGFNGIGKTLLREAKNVILSALGRQEEAVTDDGELGGGALSQEE